MTYIIAEIGSVHDGSIGNALKLIDIVRACGADCAKFQVHLAEFETRIDAPNPGYFSNESRYDYFKRTSFSKRQWEGLIEHCDDLKIEFAGLELFRIILVLLAVLKTFSSATTPL